MNVSNSGSGPELFNDIGDPVLTPNSKLVGGVGEGAEDVRHADCGRRGDVRRRELGEGSDAEEAEADADFVLEDLERADEAFRSGGAEREAGEAAEADGHRAERDGLHDIRAAHIAAIYPNLGFVAYGFHHLGQHGGRAEAVVELAAAVVRNIDDFDAVLDAKQSVLDGGDAF